MSWGFDKKKEVMYEIVLAIYKYYMADNIDKFVWISLMYLILTRISLLNIKLIMVMVNRVKILVKLNSRKIVVMANRRNIVVLVNKRNYIK